MAIRHGQILHDANGFVIDRIQTGGISNFNIKQDRIKELGNAQTVGIVRDIPDLSFEVQSLDVSTDIEAITMGLHPADISDHQSLDFMASVPVNIISPFKTSLTNFDVIRGIVVPWLTIEQAQYRFGTTSNAEKTFTYRGDSAYYVPGSVFHEENAFTGPGAYTFAHTAIEYDEEGATIFALSLDWYDVATNSFGRLFHGVDYTDTDAGFTVLSNSNTTSIPDTAILRVSYGSTATSTYLQSVNTPSSVKPAAVRGKDLDVYVSDGAATPTLGRWDGVQSFEVSRRVNLENDQEFGNSHFVDSTYDTADVTGQIVVRARDAVNLWKKIAQAAHVDPAKVVGPLTGDPLPIQLAVNHPETGARLETLYCPDAQFTLPAYQGRVQQKHDVTFPFASEGGLLYAIKGEPA